jgi:hypothetical protein
MPVNKTRNKNNNNRRITLKKINSKKSNKIIYPKATFPTEIPIDDDDIEVRPGISKGFLRRISEPLYGTVIPVEDQTKEQRERYKEIREKYWYLYNTHQFTLEEHLQLLRDGKIPSNL